MTNIVHTNKNYRNVGMLEVVNEPQQGGNSNTDSMRRTYYPTAWKRIRAAEDALKISQNNRLHIQMMVGTPCNRDSKILTAQYRTRNGAQEILTNT